MERGITLPFPGSLQEGWEEGSLNFPDVMEDEVEAYMQPSTKAMKSLLNSGHVHNVKFHHISTDLRGISSRILGDFLLLSFWLSEYPFRYKLGIGSSFVGFPTLKWFEQTLVSLVILKSFRLMSCDHFLYKLGRGHR